ncbi:MAG: hypothetical protein ACRDS0_08195 [Pseudonocardiaceae bacterium]
MGLAAVLVLSVFAACAVEAVEALTIVLAVGTARGWRATLGGVVAALVVLAAVVGVLGPAVTVLPLEALRLVVGGLLLVFGLQWLRKAVLRAGGQLALHDEDAIYSRELRAAQMVGGSRRQAVIDDPYAFTVAFKGVLLEGLEVVVIVITFGANQGSIGLATLGAGAAVVVVTGLGVLLRRPLAQVPENTMKFAVGAMLTTFGTFWGAQGAGVQWPGGDTALLVLLAFVLAGAGVAVAVAVLRGLPLRES